PEEEQAIAEIECKLIGVYGDRHQELVFIGHEMDQARITQTLDACLLTDDEFAQGPEAWANFEDPFPPIELDMEEEEQLEVIQ
ncbi:MAG: GTP-binding protein, partial [Planctomycetota bacterium]